jgi:SAM-dependent methyltransferase
MMAIREVGPTSGRGQDLAVQASAIELGVRSFRDPAGVVVRRGGRIFRIVNSEFVGELEAFLASKSANEAVASGKLVSSFRISSSDADELGFPGSAVYEHERIPFPSYPHEWPAEMLLAAGRLTLDLFQAALREGFGLKDATPYNVLFRGADPVFVDVLSFERREPLDPSWTAYAQFVRTTLLPMLAHYYFGRPIHEVFASRRDGLDPETLYQWASPLRRLMPGFLSLVTLPKWLSGKASDESYRPKRAASAEQADFILERLLKTCGRQLGRFAPRRQPGSTWSEYLEHKSLYSAQQLSAKESFVRNALELVSPKTVLDVGANEGRFSFLAANQGASVVAIDTDPVVVGTIWRQASRMGLPVLPLVVDITRPTPALGWRYNECQSFLDRARGQFDLVMLLAVIHHKLVTERIPLDEILALTAEISREYALIEFVSPTDPMFKRIARGREDLHKGLTKEAFEEAAAPYFETICSHRIDGMDRCLYLLRRRRN